MSKPLRIDVGSGKFPKEGYVALDKSKPDGFLQDLLVTCDAIVGSTLPGVWSQDRKFILCDLTLRHIPVEDSTVDALNCDNVLEHFSAGEEIIRVMNELWRVLKPGCPMFVRVPYALSVGGMQDPTHKMHWVKETFDYFVPGTHMQCWEKYGSTYGIKPWDLHGWVILEDNFITCDMLPVKEGHKRKPRKKRKEGEPMIGSYDPIAPMRTAPCTIEGPIWRNLPEIAKDYAHIHGVRISEMEESRLSLLRKSIRFRITGAEARIHAFTVAIENSD